ncbi:phosphoribosylformylglycinamidine cyclo-ligase [bacterium]|nr:phosphoribosylformylglycinamidine cyclo-ligase [bacterium]
MTYKNSGVNIDEGNLFVKKIQPFVKRTSTKDVLSGTSSFAALYKLDTNKIKDPILVSCTDGVGTKVQIGVKTNKIDGLGIDLVAMCINDLICTGAKPLFFLDYISTSKLSAIYHSRIVKSISVGCNQAKCSIVGGETAEMPGMYKKGEFDIAGFSVGVVDKKNIIKKNNVRKGDILIGLASSGPHSNGYSLIRKIYSTKKLNDSSNKKLLNSIMKPTKIYSKIISKIYRPNCGITGIAHITGGGLSENIPRIMSNDLGIIINKNNWKIPSLFLDIMDKSKLNFQEMSRVFNMGIGMVLSVKKKHVQSVKKSLNSINEKYYIIGEVVTKKGFKII